MIVASGYTLGFGRLDPPGDSGMVAPRMLGPEVRRCYEEGVGFITAVGVHHDATGRALARVLAIAQAIGGLRQGGLALTPMQEAVLDLGVEQVLSPALTAVNNAFVQTMIEHDIPIEAIVVELVLSGEVERTYRLLREVGLRGAVRVPLADESVRPAHAARPLRPPRLRRDDARARRRHRVGPLRRRVGRRARRRLPDAHPA